MRKDDKRMEPQELEAFLEQLDLSNRDFAKLVGVTPLAVSTWLNGTRKINPQAAKIVRYLKAYPLRLHEFLRIC